MYVKLSFTHSDSLETLSYSQESDTTSNHYNGLLICENTYCNVAKNVGLFIKPLLLINQT